MKVWKPSQEVPVTIDFEIRSDPYIETCAEEVRSGIEEMSEALIRLIRKLSVSSFGPRLKTSGWMFVNVVPRRSDSSVALEYR